MSKIPFKLILTVCLAVAASKTIGEDREDCLGCGGAKSGCCNTCQEIKKAYYDKNWLLPKAIFIEAAVGRQATFVPGEYGWKQCKPKCIIVKGHSTSMRREDLKKVKTREECVFLVAYTRPTASGMTFRTSDKNCWAEFGTTGTNGHNGYESCKFNLEGDDDAVKKWFLCCSIARKYNTASFKPGPNMDKWDWAGMSGANIDKWRNNGCTEVVGGVNKPKCMLDPTSNCGANQPKSCPAKNKKLCKGQDANGKFQQENAWYVDCCRWRHYLASVQHGLGGEACVYKDPAIL